MLFLGRFGINRSTLKTRNNTINTYEKSKINTYEESNNTNTYEESNSTNAYEESSTNAYEESNSTNAYEESNSTTRKAIMNNFSNIYEEEINGGGGGEACKYFNTMVDTF